MPAISRDYEFRNLSPSAGCSMSIINVAALASSASRTYAVSFIASYNILITPVLRSFGSITRGAVPLY